MASAKIRDIEKCKKAVLDICRPKDVFPSDSEGDTLWKLNSEVDELFDELNANILIIKDYYYSGDETDWKTCKRFKITSIKDNTMICTVYLMDEGDTELTFTKKLRIEKSSMLRVFHTAFQLTF